MHTKQYVMNIFITSLFYVIYNLSEQSNFKILKVSNVFTEFVLRINVLTPYADQS